MINGAILSNRETVLTIIARNINSKVENISVESSIVHLCNGNVYAIGLILYDLHEILNKDITYHEDEVLTLFPTVQDVLDYFEK